MRNSPISVNDLVEQKVTSKNLVIYLGFLIYIFFFSEVLPIWRQLLKRFQHNIGTFEALVSLMCKPNARGGFETFENILKQSVQFLKIEGLKMKCKVLVWLCSSTAPLFSFMCAVGCCLMQLFILLPSPSGMTSLTMKTSCFVSVSDNLCSPLQDVWAHFAIRWYQTVLESSKP